VLAYVGSASATPALIVVWAFVIWNTVVIGVVAFTLHRRMQRDAQSASNDKQELTRQIDEMKHELSVSRQENSAEFERLNVRMREQYAAWDHQIKPVLSAHLELDQVRSKNYLRMLQSLGNLGQIARNVGAHPTDKDIRRACAEAAREISNTIGDFAHQSFVACLKALEQTEPESRTNRERDGVVLSSDATVVRLGISPENVGEERVPLSKSFPLEWLCRNPTESFFFEGRVSTRKDFVLHTRFLLKR
jgi:hypothetical protein